MKNKYPRTDLACEANSDLSHIEGTEYSVEDKDICIIERLDIITDTASERLEKDKGRYVTVSTPKIQYLGEEEIEALSEIIGEELMHIILHAVGKQKIDRELSVLVVGLGNRDITADAIGPATADRICVTRHLTQRSPSLFDMLGRCMISVTIPGVLGKTGVESAATVKSAVTNIQPHAVIVIDALAARSTERLARTFQISDAGITPGAGIGNNRSELSRRTLGIPVISVGVPTVVDTSTLIFDTLTAAGITELTEKMTDGLSSSENLFVTPKEADVIVESSAALLSASINNALVISEK